MKFFCLILLLLAGSLSVRAQSAVDTPDQYEIGEVLVRPKYKQFQDDSAERMQIYRKVLKDVATKPGIGFGATATGGGVTMDGPLTWLARKISGRDKREKKFVSSFFADQEYRFISLRYTPELVQQMTGLSGDTVGLFMAQNPMPHDYARAASDLEIKMWIRTQYRSWKAAQAVAQQGVQQTAPVASRP